MPKALMWLVKSPLVQKLCVSLNVKSCFRFLTVNGVSIFMRWITYKKALVFALWRREIHLLSINVKDLISLQQ